MIGHHSAQRDEGGFTLIELLIVIVILGILAAIVVFAVGTTSATSAQAACHSDAKSLETALESYKAQTGAFPANDGLGDGSGLGWTTITGTATDANGNVVGPWLKQQPGTAHYRISFVGGTGVVSVSNSSGGNILRFDVPPGGTDACAANAR
ncbi:MAG TPA: prepilin-type N-terminal cleavage/methylation domain-containing protein [Acidimicrobiales bacterium]|nr:prepilin-type N-terminal cleavage/methylation domain-containing protein [Acidimicrobiales bacterium]